MSGETPVPVGSGQLPDTKRYTEKEAIRLGRRWICETSENGHRIALTMRQRNHNGKLVVERYGCTICDVTVHLEYPPLGQ